MGGFDPRVLLGQEVVVHGKRDLPGIIGSRPPHVLPPEEREKTIPMDKLFIDVGLPPDEVTALVRVGDLVTVRRELTPLQGDFVAGKAFDDRTAVVAIAACLEQLAGMRHAWDVYAVGTSQEEVGLRGAITSAYGLAPDVGIAIDVTFGDQPGIPAADTVEMNKGPALVYGPNIHPVLYEALVETAKSLELPYQVEPAPGRTGTDAWAIQVTRSGIPTALIDRAGLSVYGTLSLHLHIVSYPFARKSCEHVRTPGQVSGRRDGSHTVSRPRDVRSPTAGLPVRHR